MIDSFFLRWITISLVLHLVSAFFSSGFYHADEHYQILEFLNYRLGKSPASDLPLEFGYQMRPWLQPAIYVGIAKIWLFLGIDNPFVWATGYRLLAAFMGWLSIAGLALCSYTWIKDRQWRQWILIGFALIWYMPSFHARHSSENLGGSAFFIGISLLVLLRTRPIVLLLAGVLLGAAFEFRYQVGVMVVGTLLWLALIQRSPPRQLILVVFGILLSVAAGTLADRWGYGQWTLSPWNYVDYNLIQGHVSDMDTAPWWDYFRSAFTETWPPLGFVLLLSFLVAWIRYPRHILTWACVPLFLTHTIIGHKELRFLFPLIHAGPILFVLSIYGETTLSRFKWPLRVLFAMNVIALLATSFIPAWMPVRFYTHIYEQAKLSPQRPFDIYFKDLNPYHIAGAHVHFYRPPTLRLHPITSYTQIIELLNKSREPIYFYHQRSRLPEDAGELGKLCTVQFSTLGSWFNDRLLNRITNWTLFRCTTSESPTMLNQR